MKLFDAHIHLFEGGYPGRYGEWFPGGREVVQYEKFRRLHGVERALVVGYEGDPWASGNNRYLAKLARKHDWIVPLAYMPLDKEPKAEEMLHWWREGFYGLSFYPGESKLQDWSQEVCDVLNAWRAALSWNVTPRQVKRFAGLFKRLSETRILLSHLGMPGRIRPAMDRNAIYRRMQPILELARLPNIGVKLSGFYACNAYPHEGIEGVVELLEQAFGIERLYWGSDFAPALDEVTFAQTLSPVASMRQKGRILWGNLNAVVQRVRSFREGEALLK